MPAFALAKPVTPILQPGFSPAAAWPFCDGGGLKVKDASGNGNDGVLNGGVTWAPGPWGNRLANTAGGNVSVPNSPSLQTGGKSFTVAVTVQSNITDSGIITKSNYSGSIMEWLLYTNGAVLWQIKDTSSGFSSATSAVSIVDGKPHRVVGWLDLAALQIGIAIDAGPPVVTAITHGGTLNTAAPVTIGAFSDGHSTTGLLDNPVIANYAWSAQQRAADYADSFAYCRAKRRVFKGGPVGPVFAPGGLAFSVPDRPSVFQVPDRPTVFTVPDRPSVFQVPA